MALFFDSAWFDSRLEALGLQRSHVAGALGLIAEQVADLWKDQRELSARDVRTLSALLRVPAAEIATRETSLRDQEAKAKAALEKSQC